MFAHLSIPLQIANKGESKLGTILRRGQRLGCRYPQAHAAAAEQARASATEDGARLRGDWVAACGERDANIAAVAELRAELSRYRDATGKTAEVLEEEKARAADLTSKHRAQV